MGNASDWPIEALWANPDNPRRDIKGDPSFEGLVASIKSQGVLQPLLINKEGMILAGHRRHAAAQVVGLERVPVRVLSDQRNHVLIPLIENLQRSDLGVLEVAEYLRQCSRDHDMTAVAISDATGISTSTVCKYLKLADAPVELKERVERDEIPLNAAFELLRHDKKFIRSIITIPTLTKEIVRQRAASTIAAPTQRMKGEVERHLEQAVAAVEQLLATAPSEAFSVRYQRWLNILKDDLSDVQNMKPETPTFRGMVDAFHRQPQKARA